MNPRGYFLLLSERVLFVNLPILALQIVVNYAMIQTPVRGMSYLELIIGAVALWRVLAPPVSGLMGTSFGMLLPGVEKVLRFWFGVTSLAASLVWVVGFSFLGSKLPWFPAWMAIWALVCLSLVVQSNQSWAGVSTIGVIIALGKFGSDLAHLMVRSPWWLGTGAGGIAVWALWFGTTRESLRRQAMAARRRRENTGTDRRTDDVFRPLMARLTGGGAQIRIGGFSRGKGLWGWMRAAAFEGGSVKYLALAAAVPFVRLLIDLCEASLISAGRAELIFYKLANPAAYTRGYPSAVDLLGIVFTLLFMLLATLGLRSELLYPLSRVDRAAVRFRMLLLAEGVLVATWGLGQLVVALLAQAQLPTSQPLPVVPWFVFELGLLLGAFPLLQWATTFPRILTFFEGLPAALGTLAVGGLWMGTYFWASIARLPSAPVAIVVCLGVPVVSHVLAWRALRQHYANCDFGRDSGPLLVAVR